MVFTLTHKFSAIEEDADWLVNILIAHSAALVIQDCQLTPWSRSFLKSWESLSSSTNTLHYMKPEGSLLCLQEPATGAYFEPVEFRPHTLCFFSIHTPAPSLTLLYIVLRAVTVGFSCTQSCEADWPSVTVMTPISDTKRACSTHGRGEEQTHIQNFERKTRDHLKYVSVDGSKIRRPILSKYGVTVCIGFSWLRVQWTQNEIRGYIQKFPD
jgi:hypothetical protein